MPGTLLNASLYRYQTILATLILSRKGPVNKLHISSTGLIFHWWSFYAVHVSDMQDFGVFSSAEKKYPLLKYFFATHHIHIIAVRSFQILHHLLISVDSKCLFLILCTVPIFTLEFKNKQDWQFIVFCVSYMSWSSFPFPNTSPESSFQSIYPSAYPCLSLPCYDTVLMFRSA